jgi:hypothetical protein
VTKNEDAKSELRGVSPAKRGDMFGGWVASPQAQSAPVAKPPKRPGSATPEAKKGGSDEQR